MTKSERNYIINFASALSDELLEEEYYDAVYSSLGSQVEIMEMQGYNKSDIRERYKIEKWFCEKADLLEKLCDERGIKLWEETK